MEAWASSCASIEGARQAIARMAENVKTTTRVHFIGTSPRFERMLGAARSLASIRGRRTLALRAGALGDTILALPAIEALRRLAGPEGEVELAGTEPYVRLALGPRLATAVHSVDRARFRPLYQESADDADLLSFLRGFALVLAWSSPALLAALERKLSRLGIPLLGAPPHPPPGVHASDHLYRALSPLGIVGPAPAPRVDLDEESRLGAKEFLRRNDLREGDFIAIHPSSGSSRKNWPVARFRDLASSLRRGSEPLLWIEGEADGDVVADLASKVAAPVARGLGLTVLASVLSESRGFIGNDSGVTHLAAAVGVPSVALFGPTDPAVWAPKGVVVAGHDSGADEVWEKARSLFRSR
jgi:heptosyltransferase-2